jgi:hypothetical protein
LQPLPDLQQTYILFNYPGVFLNLHAKEMTTIRMKLERSLSEPNMDRQKLTSNPYPSFTLLYIFTEISSSCSTEHEGSYSEA